MSTNNCVKSLQKYEQEVWKDIPGREGKYQASTLGKIRSIDHVTKIWRKDYNRFMFRKFKGQLLKPCLDKDGYQDTTIGSVHRLVALAHIPNPDNKPVVNHKDGDKRNNKASNLEWVTILENTRHAVANGIHSLMRGNKIMPGDIPIILNRIAKGESCLSISKDYDVRQTEIYRIKNAQTWTRLVVKWLQQHGPLPPNKTWKSRNKG